MTIVSAITNIGYLPQNKAGQFRSSDNVPE
jgi:hypothetical protein